MLKKPENGGTPMMASQPAVKVQNVQGIRVRNPPIWRMSCSPDRPWITEPEPRNMRALKKAWVTRWKTPTPKAPMPQARNM